MGMVSSYHWLTELFIKGVSMSVVNPSGKQIRLTSYSNCAG
jgi:hypothetical protein